MTKHNLSPEEYLSEAKERFLSHVRTSDNPNDCWEWIGGKNSSGYGQIWTGERKELVHRVSFELFVGPIPKNLHVLHRCDNPICVNPSHLFLGTNQDNINDKVEKGRQYKGDECHLSKLNSEIVYKIREMIEQGYSQREIAKMFGVNRSNISHIKSHKSWKHLK